MSSLRAIVLQTQELEPLHASETEAFDRFRVSAAAAPLWAVRVEETIRVIARFGYSPTPTILLVSALAITASFRAS